MKYIWLFIKTVLRLVLKPLSFVPAIIVMYCIFNFSSQSGVSSAQLSYKVTHKLVETVDTIADLGLTTRTNIIFMSVSWHTSVNISCWL